MLVVSEGSGSAFRWLAGDEGPAARRVGGAFEPSDTPPGSGRLTPVGIV
jgi:hypothetical protein